MLQFRELLGVIVRKNLNGVNVTRARRPGNVISCKYRPGGVERTSAEKLGDFRSQLGQGGGLEWPAVRLGSWFRGGSVALCCRSHCDAGTTTQQRPLLNRALLYSLRLQEKVK